MNKFFEFKGESPLSWFLERCQRIDNVLILLLRYAKMKLFHGIGYIVFYSYRIRNAIMRGQFRLRYYLSMKLQGFKYVTMKEFFEEFPPDPSCKKCHGKGCGIIQVPDGDKRLIYCKCVHEPYKASGKKYEISGIE